MATDPPLTPDVDLPGQQHDQADLDIVVAPEPAGTEEEGDAADTSGDPGGTGASSDDPVLGNTLIRPENS